MTFRWPFMLLGLVSVPLAVWGYCRMLASAAARRVEYAEHGLVVIGRPLTRHRHVPFAVLLLGGAALLFALARPHTSVALPKREGTVILVFDVSNSMLADDVKPTRLAAAKASAAAFVERQPAEIRLGVVAFGDGALSVLAPTVDRVEALDAINRLSVGGGTSIGKGIFAALTAIAGAPLVIDEAALNDDVADIDIGYFGSAAIVLLSDGGNTAEPDPVGLAEIASVAGVEIHTVAVGTEQGAVVEIDGFRVDADTDTDLLSTIAESSGGQFFTAPNADALAAVYDSIDLDVTWESEPREVTALSAMLGAGLVSVGAAWSIWRNGRVV